MSHHTLHNYKLIIAAIAVVLIFLFRFLERRDVKGGKNGLDFALALLALVAVFAYFDFGHYPKFGRFLNPHDFFHYYLGSKYSDELGYLNLYPCVIVASYENNRELKHRTYRDMQDYSFKPAKDVISKAAQYKAPFTETRWQEFRANVRFFEGFLGSRRWPGVVQDKGYNATPVWNMTARYLTNLAPLRNSGYLRVLMLLDLALIAIMILLAQRAFGHRTALFLLIFFCTCYSMSYTHCRGAFLRLDWVALLVMTICMLKMGRYKTAGALMAYAGMARIFPLVFAFGIGAKFLWDIARTRRLDRKYVEFFAVFGLGAAALVLLSAYLDGGYDRWGDFFRKISLHDNDISGMRVGFKYVFLMTHKVTGGWSAFEQAQWDKLERYRLLLWGIQGAVLVLSFFLIRGLDDYEALAYGFVPGFYLAAPTFYYQVMMIVPFMLFIPKRDRLSRAIGAAAMFVISIGLFLLDRKWTLDMTLCFIFSCMLMALTFYIMVVSLTATLALSKESKPAQP